MKRHWDDSCWYSQEFPPIAYNGFISLQPPHYSQPSPVLAARLSGEQVQKTEVTREAKKEKMIFVRSVGVSELLSGFLGDLSTGDSQSEAGSVTHKD